ncbi:MAG: branched-chain amino acid ABC transporter permease, partial [Planctomycetota bacterium]|nr:branched-chain amino acid ABC transporter permease [Planctomycetota bacterium]
LSGCVVGAFLVIGTERFLARAVGFVEAWWQVEFPLILALMIIFRPQGIFGRREITDVWRALRVRFTRA